MLHFIEQRCTDFKDNQTRMINSILQRTQDKIIIDRVEVDNDLITDTASIRSHTVNHFQNIVGRPASDGSIPEEWQQDYSPLESIDDSIYAGLNDPLLLRNGLILSDQLQQTKLLVCQVSLMTF